MHNESEQQPLIFEHSAPKAHRAGWMILTLLSWGVFLYLLLPGVTSFVLASSGKLSNPVQILALLRDFTLDGFVSIGRVSGGALAFLVGCTSVDRIFRQTRVTALSVLNSTSAAAATAAPAAAALVTTAPASVAAFLAPAPGHPAPNLADTESGFDLNQLAAVQQAQRMIVHHDEHGKLVAVTLLTDQTYAQAMKQVDLPASG
jgi:PgaD-like protein